MFLVANATGGEICISDLNLSLGVKQAIDLHKIKLSIDPEKSGDLSRSIKKGFIKVLKRDSKKSKKIQETKIINKNYKTDQEELLRSISLILKNEVPVIVKNEIENQNQDNKELLDAIDSIKGLVKNQKGNVIVKEGTTIKGEEDLDLDNETRVQIHKKTVDSMIENAEGNLEYKDQEVIDDNISGDLDLLEDLF